MATNDRIQADVDRAKDRLSDLKADADRKVAEAKFDIEVERTKAKVANQLDNLAAKDERAFRTVSADAKGFVASEAAKDAAEFNATSADFEAKREKLQA